METTHIVLETELSSWTKIILNEEQLSDISVKITGQSEKGDGSNMGDIICISAEGLAQDGSSHTHNLVLKCSKRSKTLRKNSPVKDTFMNEITVYHKILPHFTQFQEDQDVEHPFNSAPKCYGCITGDDTEVIFLEDLKSSGYEMWPKQRPLTRKHLDLVATEYGKLHAISVALKNQQPAQFEDLAKSVKDVYKMFSKPEDLNTLFATAIDESAELLQSDLDPAVLQKWKNLKGQINFIFSEMLDSLTGLRVILHGDCWSNNFMFTRDDGDMKVAFLDWQVSKYSSPILDLSYFLFTSASKDDLENLEDILTTYYESFQNHLCQLGCKNADALYPLGQFLDDWKSYSKYGILMASLVLKVACTGKDEAEDLAEGAENGQAFLNEFKDQETYKTRIKPVVECAVKHDLI